MKNELPNPETRFDTGTYRLENSSLSALLFCHVLREICVSIVENKPVALKKAMQIVYERVPDNGERSDWLVPPNPDALLTAVKALIDESLRGFVLMTKNDSSLNNSYYRDRMRDTNQVAGTLSPNQKNHSEFPGLLLPTQSIVETPHSSGLLIAHIETRLAQVDQLILRYTQLRSAYNFLAENHTTSFSLLQLRLQRSVRDTFRGLHVETAQSEWMTATDESVFTYLTSARQLLLRLSENKVDRSIEWYKKLIKLSHFFLALAFESDFTGATAMELPTQLGTEGQSKTESNELTKAEMQAMQDQINSMHHALQTRQIIQNYKQNNREVGQVTQFEGMPSQQDEDEHLNRNVSQDAGQYQAETDEFLRKKEEQWQKELEDTAMTLQWMQLMQNYNADRFSAALSSGDENNDQHSELIPDADTRHGAIVQPSSGPDKENGKASEYFGSSFIDRFNQFLTAEQIMAEQQLELRLHQQQGSIDPEILQLLYRRFYAYLEMELDGKVTSSQPGIEDMATQSHLESSNPWSQSILRLWNEIDAWRRQYSSDNMTVPISSKLYGVEFVKRFANLIQHDAVAERIMANPSLQYDAQLCALLTARYNGYLEIEQWASNFSK